MVTKLRAMLVKELKQMLRDPKMRVVVFVMPLLQLLVFSFALTMDVKNIDIAVLDYDKSSESRAVADSFEASGYFFIEYRPESISDIKRLMDRGDVRGAVVFPEGFEKDVLSGRGASVQVIADGTMSNDAGIIINYASGVVSTYAAGRNIGVRDGAGVVFQHRNLFNPNLLSRFYYVPGLISLMIMVTSMILTSIAIVREKEIGTIEQVMVTPISRTEFIIGKTLPFMITGLFTTTMMFVLARIIFGISIRGNPFLLFIIVLLSIVTYLGLALLVSAASRTQQQALLTSFFLMMPSALLSGYMFPVANMPEAVQYFTALVPMRWSLEGIIGVVVKGATAAELSKQLLWLSGHALFFFVFASLKFKKTLE
ncbi:ABC transporter permease [Seleniivibrio woodruffii]|uniref:Transport permease protein n=1 Tax=Seleniivibrio woodruffii TaxID=1078050 RepID=A0A4V2PSG3_9BACT|nr:ABC transporter permease [Seleniivibrio woodruffii]TCK62541.1 ABC-2 type transport system permease protein [Seleniivibrio woodruffii]TVZ37032.1 ABC-2 type transport system permease protein [Seleniivibrio woodruffii]